MNYYERYCGDSQRDTAHLSLAEHGAYTMLLDVYLSVEKPLPKELSSLRRVERCDIEKGQRKFMKSYLNMEKAKANGYKEKYQKYQHLRDA